MKARYILLVIFILIAWLAGSLMFTRPLEKKLQIATAAELAKPEHKNAFDKVKVSFAGQEATLTGQVLDQATKDLAEKIVLKDIRLLDDQPKHNPVTQVHNQLVIDDSSLPRPWLIVTSYEGNSRIDGVLRNGKDKLALIEALKSKPTTAQCNDQCLIDTTTVDCKDWQATLTALPDFTKLTEGKKDHAARFAAATTGDGQWQIFPHDVKNDAIVTHLAASGVSNEFVEFALNPMRTETTAEEKQKKRAAEFEKLQAEKAAADMARLEAERMAKEKADAEAAARAATSLPAYIGIAGDAKKLSLFGAVPSEKEKTDALASAVAAFTGATIDHSKLAIDATRAIPQGASLGLTIPKPEKEGSFVGLFPLSGGGKWFPADVYDSELANAYPELKLDASALSQTLDQFRLSQVEAGTINRDEPYLNLLSDGKTLTLAGEVNSEETKNAIVAAVKSTNPTQTLVDQLKVSPLVSPTIDLGETSKVPALQPNMSAIAIARPGQPWRSAVIHSIYFPTGSNRSKDQERAIQQMRRVKALLPQAKFEIVGHTDNVGKRESNVKLSLDRANAFLAYSQAAGIDTALLSARGAGPDEPIAPNNTDSGKALNRRVDVMLK